MTFLVLEGKLEGCSVIVGNALEIVLEAKLTCIRFPSLCNVFVSNALVLVVEGNISCASFSYSRL